MTCSSLKDFGCYGDVGGFSNWVRHRSPGAHLSPNVEWTFTSATEKFTVTKDSWRQNETAKRRRQNYIDNSENKAISFFIIVSYCALCNGPWGKFTLGALLCNMQSSSRPRLSLRLPYLLSKTSPNVSIVLIWLCWSVNKQIGLWPRPPANSFPPPYPPPPGPAEAVHYIFSWNISIHAISL